MTRVRGLGDAPGGPVGDWKVRHVAACESPRAGHEQAMVTLAEGIRAYVQAMQDAYGSPHDGVLVPQGLAPILAGFIGLLNGELGRLDAGTCWSWADEIAKLVGWDLETDKSL